MTQVDVTAESGGNEPAEGLEAAPTTEPTTEQPKVQGAEQETAETDVPRFTVKVDGQDLEVTQDELLNGYQRQADYTRKTQDLSARAQELEAAETLWQALREDPKQALTALQEHFAEALEEEPLDPEEQRLRQVEGFMAEQQAREFEAQVTAEISRLQSEYEDFGSLFETSDGLIQFAIDNEIPNLEAALAFKRQQNERAAREQTRLNAKQTAPAIDTHGSRQEGSTADAPAEINSVEDAIRASMKELGVRSLTDLPLGGG